MKKFKIITFLISLVFLIILFLKKEDMILIFGLPTVFFIYNLVIFYFVDKHKKKKAK